MRGLYITLIAICLVGCDKSIKRPKPTQVVYDETIRESDSDKVVRHCYYTLDSVQYDTITKRKQSTIEPSQRYVTEPGDKVDLNEILSTGEDDPTDYNFTELDDEGWRYLESLGIYWDDSSGCYRKRK